MAWIQSTTKPDQHYWHPSLTHELTKQLEHLSRSSYPVACRDYCNSLLYGVSHNLIRRVQSVQTTQAALLLTGAGRRDHISPVLRQLHWLPVQRRVVYKLACFVFSSLSGHAPPHLDDDILLVSESHRRRYALPPTDRVPFHAHTTHSATGASLSPGRVFGTVFRPTCATRTLRTALSGLNSKLFVLLLLPGRNETFVNCAI